METVFYIVGGIAGLFVMLQVWMRVKTRFKKGKPAPELTGKYAKALQSGKPALFYFYTDSCAACRPMTPIIEKYRKKNRNVFKIDARREIDLVRKFGIMGTPSTILVEDGVIKEFLVGPQAEEKIAAYID